MFAENDEDVVFMETSMHLRRHPHMVIEAVPMPKEVGDMAPIYFKARYDSNFLCNKSNKNSNLSRRIY